MAVPVLAPDEMYPAGAEGVTARFITTATGERVRIAEAGDPASPVALLLHGWGCSIYSFRHLYAPLVARGLHVVALDLRGHGLTDKPMLASSYTLPAMVSHVMDVVGALQIHNPILVGHSMGGRIAAEIALRDPQFAKALLLINSAGFGPMPHVSFARPFAMLSVARRLPAPLPSWLVRIPIAAVYGTRRRCTDVDVAEYRAPSQFREYLVAMVLLLRNFDWRELADADVEVIRAQAHLVAGELDRVVMTCRSGGAERRRAVGWRVVTVSGVAHVVHEESPDEIVRVLDDILRN